MSCQCFTGTAFEDAQGNCHCLPNDGTPPIIIKQTLFNKMRSINNVTPPFHRGVFTPPIKSVPAVNAKCPTAPNGYVYVFDGVNCNLQVDYNYSPSNATGVLTGGVNASNPLSGIGDAIRNNPLIALGLIGGVAYMIFGKGMKPKRRESVVTTQY